MSLPAALFGEGAAAARQAFDMPEFAEPAAAVEQFDFPTCEVPAGSTCRTRGGTRRSVAAAARRRRPGLPLSSR
ncbi:hypothetical protein ACWD5Q_28420 [Streptomyces sp. NPDC002513]